MPRDYHIVISVNGGNARGYRSGGNVSKTKNTLRGRNNMKENGEEQSLIDLKRVFTIGLAFNTLQKGVEIAGAYSEDRLRQRENQVGQTFIKYGIGLMVNPLVGGIYAGGDLGYRAIQYNIGVNKKNREARKLRNISGNNAYMGRKYRGGRV